MKKSDLITISNPNHFYGVINTPHRMCFRNPAILSERNGKLQEDIWSKYTEISVCVNSQAWETWILEITTIKILWTEYCISGVYFGGGGEMDLWVQYVFSAFWVVNRDV